MAELKAGGLALVIASGNNREIGKSVTLVKQLADGEFYKFPNGSSYSMKSSTGQAIWVVSGDVSVYTSKPSSGLSIFPSRCLMPINGDESPDVLRYTKEISNV